MSLAAEATTTIAFTLNGSPKRLAVPLGMSALDAIRDVLGLTGTKYGCGEGECGACTIVIDGVSVNSCLAFAVDLDGRKVTTVEGVAADPALAKLRDALVEAGGVQCGFCTPGIVVQAKYLIDNGLAGSRAAIKRGLEGNLCRCTGYKKIIDAVAAAAGVNT
jgi:carbon-monoxide dehydrogenase small subunit